MKKSLLTWLACLTSFVSFAQITTGSFAPKFDLSLGAYTSVGSGFISDLDGDSKPEIIAFTDKSTSQSAISIFQNVSTPGVLSPASFNPRLELLTSANTTNGYAEDLDGDGKKDLIINRFTGTSPATFSYYLNTGSPGTISFAAPQSISVTSSISNIVLKDIDGDGKKDAVLSMWFTREVRVFLNTSIPGSISFSSTPYSISIGSSGGLIMLVCEDFNGDNKPDVALCNYDNSTLHVLKNTSTTGAVSFATPINYTTGSAPGRISSGDIDRDGKPDLLVSNYHSATIGIYKNVSTVSSLSFNSAVTYATISSSGPTHLHAADFDNNGKHDLVVSNENASSVSVFSNFGIPGSISSATLTNRKEYTTSAGPEAFTGDLDSDGKVDIITINRTAGTISILQNIISPSHDLVGLYDFTGNTGDSSGYENHAVKYSGATLSADRKAQANSAYYFDGTSSAYIQAPASTSLNTATMTNFFVSAWINPASGVTGQPNGTVWMFLQSNNTNYSLVHHLNTNLISFHNFNGVNYSTTSLISKTTLLRDKWYHIAVRIDSANKASLFIDGILDTSIVYSPLKPVSPTFTIGKNPSAGVSNNWAFLGGIDEVKVYRRYVTDDEIIALSGGSQKKYYSKSSGDLNQLSTWGTNIDGSGTSPLSFDSNNVTYYVRNNLAPVIGGSLKINGANSVLVLGDGTNPFNLAVSASDTLLCDSIYLNNAITLTVYGRVISLKMAAGTSSMAQYIGTASPQYIAAGTYTTLFVNGNGADKTLTGNTTVTNQLVMTANINTLAHNLTLGSSAGNTGTLTRTAGTINGKFTRWFSNATNSGTSGLFPVGNASRYAPFQVEFTSAPTGGGLLTTEFIAADPGNTGLPVLDYSNGIVFVDKAAIDGYWKVTGTINSGSFTTITTVNNFTGVNAYSDLRLMKRSSGGGWSLPGNHITNTGSNASAVVSRSNLTGPQGEYGIGSDKSINPLPVKLISFDGKRVDHSVELNWSTASEINNKGFEVQRSVDGKYFEKTGFVKGNGSTAASSSYTFTDRNASPGEVLYYRLNQLDVNGASSLTNTITISAVQSLSTASFSVYPNPSSHTITLKGLEQPAMVYDALGNKVMMIGTDETTDISSLANGIYFIRSGTRVQKLVKQ